MEDGPHDAVVSSDPRVTARMEPSSVVGLWTVTFQGPAVPGALAAFAGVLTAAQLGIVSATINVGLDGTLTDVFDVAPLYGALLERDCSEELAEGASAVLSGGRDIAAELRQLGRGRIGSALEPSIEVSTESELTTGVKVVCADRPGLLFDLTSTFTEHELRVRSLSVLTFRGRAHDAFRLVDRDGKPPRDPLRMDALQQGLRVVCS